MYLFFDTETTGLPISWTAPVEAVDNWPRLVQLAWLLSDDSGNEIKGVNHIIKPEGFIIPKAASKVHGITTEKALKEGRKLADVLDEFVQILNDTKILVAHNIKFDEKIMGAELFRNSIMSSFFELDQICTMHSSTKFCQIEGNYGYKWPKLIELHEKLFGVGFDGAHDALEDVRATKKCFFELKSRGVL